jgi:PAS domain S-box-containing protein
MSPQISDTSGFSTVSQPPQLSEKPKALQGFNKELDGAVAIFETDKNGFITSWSPNAEQVYGYEPYDMVGKHMADLYTAGDLLHGKLTHELRSVESRGAYFTFGWQKRNNENEFWAYTEFEAIKDNSGKLLGYRKYVLETPASLQSTATC